MNSEKKNNPPLIDIDDKDPSLKKNRIRAIEIDVKNNQNVKKTILIISSIAVIAILAILIIIKFFYDKPESFSPQPDTKVVQFNNIKKEISIKTENIHIKRGMESYSRGYFNDAISEFKGVIESNASDKDKAVALTYMGMIMDDRGNHDKAIELYSRAQIYNKEDPDIYKNLSLAYRHKKDYENAIKSIEKSISLNSEDFNSMILLGNMYFELGRYKDATAQYNEALKISPENPSVLYNLASAILKTGDEFAAIEYFKKAGAIDRIGDIAHRAYSRLGVIYTERKINDLAEEYLKQAISIRPKNAVTRYNLGIVYLRNNKKQQALEEFSKAEELGKNNSEMLENIGDAYFSMNDYNKSLNTYQKLLNANERNIKILSRIAEIYYEKGELDRAYDSYKKITTIEPATENARIAYLNMGNILDDAQRFDEAIEAYQKAISISPKDDSSYYNLGIAYKHANKPELAIDSWKKAAELNSNNPKPLIARADYYYENNYYDLAEKEYLKIINKWPNTQEAHFKIATIYYKRDQYEYAIKAYRRALEINKNNDIARRSYINIAILTTKIKKDEESINESRNLIQKALLLKPGDPEALFSLGIIYSQKEMHNKAIETFYQVIKSSNDSKLIAKTYGNIGKIYYAKNEYKKALQSFTRGIEEDPTNEKIRMNRKVAMQAYEAELVKKNE